MTFWQTMNAILGTMCLMTVGLHIVSGLGFVTSTWFFLGVGIINFLLVIER